MNAESTDEVLGEIRNRVAFITLNRPSALNALSLGMIGSLRAMLHEYAGDADVRALVIAGAGDKAFCAGGDIRALHYSVQNQGSLHHEFFAAEYPVDYLLHTYPKPYVVVMDGITMGGGMGLAQGSTLRVVGDRTRIAMPEVAIGLFPDVGASYFLSRLPGSLGAYLALTGIQIRGADALYARLADVYLDAEALESLGERIATLPAGDDFSGDLRRLIFEGSAQGLPAPSLSVLRPAIDQHFSQSSVLGILDSLAAETRPAYRDWAEQTTKLMRSRSPTMLAVTHEQLQRGRKLDLAECFRMEFGMVQQCFVQGDFLEGIRALMIDKDNAPKWRPDRSEDVTPASVQAFFRERWRGRSHPLFRIESTPLQF